MKIILFWLLASGSYLAAMALPATGAEAFQCDVLEFHDESPTRAQDDALIKRSMKRTFVILVGEREITAVSKSAYDEASSLTYTRLPDTSLEKLGMATSMLGVDTIAISLEPNSHYGGRYPVSVGFAGSSHASVWFLSCEKT